ncbi:MAG: hypothetical protein FJZ87_07405 [Chloroflexi bacterium]|nr:hypothetical protein [Chloroflexota bacterium]
MAVNHPSLMLSDLHSGLQFREYRLLEHIGAGGQAVVWSAEDTQRNDIAAIKFNEIDDSAQQQVDDVQIERQLEKLVSVRHTHILPVYDYGLEGKIRYLVSPYVTGGSLFDKIKRGPLPLGDGLRFATEVASALECLHSQRIIHRDLKPSNILLNLRQHSYLADFGLARAVSATTQAMHTGRGTPPYAPPEQHKLAEITHKSDIYSFGILLYEIFTGRLPWEGERMLGIQQLYSNVELPDPLEFNNRLPPLMADVLRRVTSADPVRRPSSAGEVMKMIYYIFNIKSFPTPDMNLDAAEVRARDVEELLSHNLARWSMAENRQDTDLTRFALIHQEVSRRQANESQAGLGRFMLFHALKYGYREDDWWAKVTSPQERASVLTKLLDMRNEVVAVRVLDHLLTDRELRAMFGGGSSVIINGLLEMAADSKSPELAGRLIEGTQALVPAVAAWSDSGTPPGQERLLGGLAIEDSETGDRAARLIGHLRSQPAVRFILENADPGRLSGILLEIQQFAGSLPAFVSRGMRLRVFLEWAIQRVTFQSNRLAGAYGFALIGATFGIATQVFLTYRLPQFMDTARISSSLIQGLIIGSVFSLGILKTRVVVERFAGANGFLRILSGTLLGALVINIAMFIFHVLFIDTVPSGFLIPLGCLLIAFAFSVGGLIRWRLVKMILASGAVFLAIAGTWWIHTTMAGSTTDLTPFLRYDYAWSNLQTSLTALAVALWIGIPGNLVHLAVREE